LFFNTFTQISYAMSPFSQLSIELEFLVKTWEPRLYALSEEVISKRRNTQNRNIRQILGHLIDSASNNTHRIIHLHYQTSPISFPDYAHFGNNDRWIAIQNYEEENWEQLVGLWKYCNLHLVHLMQNIRPEKLKNEWISALGDHISLEEMVKDYPRHFKLHLGEIEELLK
jgi:hypothetical protein